MEKLSLNEIRELFLNFYEKKEHFRRESFSLIPDGDKSLLIINSGMAPLKPYFAGIKEPPSKRMATCQKCIRTADIENVGKTSRHGTFFEMLGSFSFGDYFKEESITWGWEFITEVLDMPKDKLWATVYLDDQEAYDIWKNKIGMPEDRIVKLGKDDNFWEIGVGPCGPCSEIYFDRGEEYGCDNPDCKPGCDCDRYIEFWNHVFTQFNRLEDGSYEPLEHPNIDTGMGLERISCIMQGTDSIFDVDTIRSILDEVCNIANIKYCDGKKDSDISIRIITDHIRSATFMISDGIMPSNEGRGYVLRRLIRRAIRHGKKIGINEQFLSSLVDKVIENSKNAYPSLIEQEVFIKKIIQQEEDRFSKTLNQGLDIIEGFVKDLKSRGEKHLPGNLSFKLHDTFGFPFEITQEILSEKGITALKEDFEEYMNNQKLLGKKDADSKDFAWEKDSIDVSDLKDTEFTGYFSSEEKGKILQLIVDGSNVDAVKLDDEAIIIVDKTPFYATGGGQANDKGRILADNFEAEVIDVKKKENIFIHIVKVLNGSLSKGDDVTLKVDVINRNNSSRNHSCTHLLHQALRDTLGTHVKQAGSFVNSDILRFDFSHFEALTENQIAEIENSVNEKIDLFLPLVKEEMSVAEAEKAGALGLFADKYGDVVRVVSIGDYSKELCGGIHVNNSGEIGGFKILSESGISSGVRRIEAITGRALREYASQKDILIRGAANILKTKGENLMKKLESTLEELKLAKDSVETFKRESRKNQSSDLLSSAYLVDGVKVIKKHFVDYDVASLKNLCDELRDKEDNLLIVFVNSNEDKHTLIVAISQSLKDRLNAGSLVKVLAPIAEGKGGGKPDMAQAGLKNPNKIDDMLKEVDNYIS